MKILIAALLLCYPDVSESASYRDSYARHHGHHHRRLIKHIDRGRITLVSLPEDWPSLSQTIAYPWASGTAILDAFTGATPTHDRTLACPAPITVVMQINGVVQ